MRIDPNTLLLHSVAQTIDALSFTQSHVIDEDFRAHSRATIDSVRSLQREQRGRIDNAYGPRSLSSTALAVQLAATYRGETAALEMAKENRSSNSNDDPTLVVTAHMTLNQCQAFKREMKQRIHEWERAFRDEHGVSVTAHDKAALRHVYELYKAAKNRLRDSESPHNGSTERPITHRNASEEQQRQRQQERREEEQQQQQQQQQPLHVMHNGDVGDHRRDITAGGLHLSSLPTNQLDTVGGVAFTVPAVMTSSVHGVTYSSTSSLGGRGAPVAQMSNDDLATEKRYLKRILHHFESEFEQQNGHAPTKNDRRAFTREYTRYGELKNEIQRRAENLNLRENNSNAGTDPTVVGNGELPASDSAVTAAVTTAPGMPTTSTIGIVQ